jgi:hypothetical protein
LGTGVAVGALGTGVGDTVLVGLGTGVGKPPRLPTGLGTADGALGVADGEGLADDFGTGVGVPDPVPVRPGELVGDGDPDPVPRAVCPLDCEPLGCPVEAWPDPDDAGAVVQAVTARPAASPTTRLAVTLCPRQTPRPRRIEFPPRLAGAFPKVGTCFLRDPDTAIDNLRRELRPHPGQSCAIRVATFQATWPYIPCGHTGART